MRQQNASFACSIREQWVTIVKDETSFDLFRRWITYHSVDVGGPAHCKDILAGYISPGVLMDLSVVIPLTLPDSVPDSYGVEHHPFRTAQRLCDLQSLNLSMPQRPRPILEAESAPGSTAAAALAVH